MDFVSTRGKDSSTSFTDVVLSGLACDGGLFTPRDYPKIERSKLDSWRNHSYPELASELISMFASDIPREVVDRLTRSVYTDTVFASAEIAPLSRLEPDLYLAHLSTGPTLAFKDVAMQFIGELFQYALEKRGDFINILGATSGDTGPAAEHAMLGKDRVNVFMLSPHGRMSPFQRAQMFGLLDNNIHNLSVEGTFDDCQSIVKSINTDAEFKEKHKIGAVNSINFGRIVAQVVYYFYSYYRATAIGGEEVDFSVPTGNFGNIFAGHVAKEMGLPIGRLIVATNENRLLHEFFSTGVYHLPKSHRAFETSSPSMDVSNASNLERFIFDLLGRDSDLFEARWGEMLSEGKLDLTDRKYSTKISDRFGFVSGTSSHADRISLIRSAWSRWGVVVDPHTADGLKVGLEHRRENVPLIVMETALPAKFERTMVEALGRVPVRPEILDGIENLPQRVKVVSADPEEVKAYISSMANYGYKHR